MQCNQPAGAGLNHVALEPRDSLAGFMLVGGSVPAGGKSQLEAWLQSLGRETITIVFRGLFPSSMFLVLGNFCIRGMT